MFLTPRMFLARMCCASLGPVGSDLSCVPCLGYVRVYDPASGQPEPFFIIPLRFSAGVGCRKYRPEDLAIG